MFDALAIAQPHIQAGSIRPLAVTGPTPMAALPERAGGERRRLPDFEVVNWYGMVVRSGTPAAMVARLHQEVAFALRQPAMSRSAPRRWDSICSAPRRSNSRRFSGRDREMGRGDQERQHSRRLIGNCVASIDVDNDFGPAAQLHSGYFAPKM